MSAPRSIVLPFCYCTEYDQPHVHLEIDPWGHPHGRAAPPAPSAVETTPDAKRAWDDLNDAAYRLGYAQETARAAVAPTDEGARTIISHRWHTFDRGIECADCGTTLNEGAGQSCSAPRGGQGGKTP